MTQNTAEATSYHGVIEIGNLVHASQVDELRELFGVDGVVIDQPIAETPSDTAPTSSGSVHFSGITDQDALDELHDEIMDICYVANIYVAPEGTDISESSARMISWSTRPIGDGEDDEQD